LSVLIKILFEFLISIVTTLISLLVLFVVIIYIPVPIINEVPQHAATLIGLLFALIAILIIGIGAIVSLSRSLYKNLAEVNHFHIVDRPYKRLISSLGRKLFFWCLGVGTISFIGLIFYGLFPLDFNLALSILFVLNAAVIVFLASSLFSHIVLRYCLWREKVLPFRFVQFFDFCVDLRLLERDGGYWRFRHQILQEHFAEMKDIQQS
ncbi:MAG: hypothetical protein AAF512_01340, partial [Pseudomonadota bacterium]